MKPGQMKEVGTLVKKVYGFVENVGESAEIAQISNRRLLDYVNMLLDYEKAPNLARYDERIEIEEIVQNEIRLMGNEGGTIKITPNIKVKSEVLMNRRSIQIILSNLLRNAKQSYKQEAQKRIDVEADVMDIKGNPHLYVGIRDFGKGMTPKIQEKALQLYFTTKGDGAGLGLPWVVSIIEKGYNGRFRLMSSP